MDDRLVGFVPARLEAAFFVRHLNAGDTSDPKTIFVKREAVEAIRRRIARGVSCRCVTHDGPPRSRRRRRPRIAWCQEKRTTDWGLSRHRCSRQ